MGLGCAGRAHDPAATTLWGFHSREEDVSHRTLSRMTSGIPSRRPPPPDTAVVGRDVEREAIVEWLEGSRPALLEIEGEAGIGKTTLWEHAVGIARERGAAVLGCRPAEIESAVSYGALASLLEPVLERVRTAVPAPRLRALEGALRLRGVSLASLDETAVALGALSVLRAAAGPAPLLLAVDDVQWLDPSTRVALTYALRNLRSGDDVAVLLTRRLGAGAARLDLEGAAVARSAATLRPGPLSLGALHRMITGRLGAPLSRPRIVHVHATSGGNPLYALELARMAATGGLHDATLSADSSLTDVLRARVGALSVPAQRLLLVVAAAGEPTPALLARASTASEDDPSLDEALRDGVLAFDGERVRFSHPLLASTVYAAATEPERRRVHAALAALVETPEERARHLARATSGPDETVAAALERAAASACAHGARGTGALLYEQAASLTPPANGDVRAARLVAAADAHFLAGEPGTARTLLETVAAGDGPLRFHAFRMLGTLLDETVGGDAACTAFERALESDDRAVAAEAHRGLAQSLAYVGRLDDALRHADASVAAAAPLADGTCLVHSLAMQAFVRRLAGHGGWREALERALRLEPGAGVRDLDACPSAVAADLRRLLLDLDGAREAYDRLLVRAADAGDVRTECWCRFGLASVEIAAGRYDRAAGHAAELRDLAEQTALLRLPSARTAAHLAILTGDVAGARATLERAVAEAESSGELHNLRSALQLEGLLELSRGDHAAAAAALARARSIAEQTALGEPGLLLFLLDEVEALAGLGDAAAAADVLNRFVSRCSAPAPGWVAPLVRRARGIVHAAERDLESAREALAGAVAAEDVLPLPLEQARTRLALGRVLRRLQARRDAQTMLDDALQRFDALGAALWAERAREELARIGGRAPSHDDLTATEGRIAKLVAEGMTNREVAAMLFVTPKTVESALTRVYRKLDVRSRTELARRLADAA